MDAHHTVEDVGIAIGEALRQALGDKAGLARYGHAVVPLDEALVEAVVDLSGRPHLTFNAKLPSGKKFIGAYDVDLTQDFLQALVNHARICVHVNVRYGRNLHHVVEAIFKATARALRAATAREGRRSRPRRACCERRAGHHRARRLRRRQPPLGRERAARGRRRGGRHPRPGRGAPRRPRGGARAGLHAGLRRGHAAERASTRRCAR